MNRLSLLILICCASSTVRAQQSSRGTTSDVLEAQVRAQAELIRAQAESERAKAKAAKEYALASDAVASAAAAGQDLKIKTFETYWELKEKRNQEDWERLERRIENARKPMVLEAARENAMWERSVKGDLDTIRNGIRSGSLLNRVARQIDRVTGLSASDHVSSQISGNLSPIDEKSLRALQLSVASMGGPVSVSLASELPEAFERWPYLFRDPELRDYAYRVNKAATPLFKPGTSNLSKFDLEQRALTELERATNAFYRKYHPRSGGNVTVKSTQRFHDAEKFLHELGRTISQQAEIDERYAVERPSFFDLHPPEERNAATLVRYLVLHGLEIQPAKPGTEVVYDKLFIQFRNLAGMLNAAPDPESITEPLINLDLGGLMKDEPGQ